MYTVHCYNNIPVAHTDLATGSAMVTSSCDSEIDTAELAHAHRTVW